MEPIKQQREWTVTALVTFVPFQSPAKAKPITQREKKRTITAQSLCVIGLARE